MQVLGYVQHQEARIAAVNANKVLEERVLRQLDALSDAVPVAGYDPRMIALARTQIQQGFMWLTRAILQPTRIGLPED